MFKYVGIMPYYKSKNIHFCPCIARGLGVIRSK